MLTAAASPSGVYLAPCSRDAAGYSVHRWHYSRSMPAGRLVHFGAWYCGRFIGAVIFGRGASSEIHSPFGLQQSDVCELCRVALGPHTAPTSKIVSLAVRLLHRFCPSLRLIVSYADPEHGHVGTLYQSMNWLYLGTTHRECLIQLRGDLRHPRTIGSRYGTRDIQWLRAHVDPAATRIVQLPKFKYALPLTDDLRRQLAPMTKSYPKRPKEQAPATSAQDWDEHHVPGRSNRHDAEAHV